MISSTHIIYHLNNILQLNVYILVAPQQDQPPEVFYKKSALKNLTKLTGKTCARALFLIKSCNTFL